MTFTEGLHPEERIPRYPNPIGQREIDALLSALPLDIDQSQTPETLLVEHINWAIEAVIKIQELGPEGFMHNAFWQARGEIESDDGKFNYEALRKFAVQMIALGQYNANKKIVSTIQD